MKALLLLSVLFSMALAPIAEARSLKRKPSQAESSEKKTISAHVVKIREDDGGVNVFFSTNSKETYYLAFETSNFEAMRKLLDESLQSKKPVSVTVDSESNIVEVK